MTAHHSPNLPHQPYDVFLSHKNDDKPSVEQLALRLAEEEKFAVRLDKWNLIPGEPWQEGQEEALDQSRTCAVFLGRERLRRLASRNVGWEGASVSGGPLCADHQLHAQQF